MLPPIWIMALIHFRVGVILHVIPKSALWELEAPWQLLPSYEGEHFEWAHVSQLTPISVNVGKPLDSHMVGWEYLVHLDTPTMIEWIVGGRVHQKSSVGKVTHMSTVLTLSGLTSGVPFRFKVKSLGLSHPLH